jgi:superfamily I DNA/RNA helicase
MSWWIQFNKLSQKQIDVINYGVNSKQNCIWIKGFAGTGKTLILIHLIERLLALNPSSTFCFITYTNSLVELVRSSPIFERKKSNINIMTHTNFLKKKKRYNFVFVDEIQDIELYDLKKISKLSDRLFVAGDYDQHIYPDISTSEKDIYQCYAPNNVYNPTLTEVFRITKNVCLLAKLIYPGAKIVEGFGAAKKNSSINIIKAMNQGDEFNWVIQNSANLAIGGKPSAIILSKHKIIYDFLNSISIFTQKKLFSYLGNNYRDRNISYNDFNLECENAGLPYRYLGGGVGSMEEADKNPIVYITTIHSAKGLDFNNVFIPNLDSKDYFSSSKQNDTTLEQRLLLVAVTRSRENLFLSYHTDSPQPFIKSIPKNVCNMITLGPHDVHSTPDIPPPQSDTHISGIDNINEIDYF